MTPSRRWFLTAAVFAASATSAMPLRAQLCSGGPSIRDGMATIDGGAAFASGVQAFAAGLTIGTPSGFFFGGRIGRTTFDDLDEATTDVGVGVGAAVPTDAAGTVEVCPFVRFEYSSLPEIEGVKISARGISGGVAFGGAIGDPASTIQFAPFASVRYGQFRTTIDGGFLEESISETAGLLTFGAGLISDRILAIVPSVSFPLNQDDSDPTFGVSLSFLLGRKR